MFIYKEFSSDILADIKNIYQDEARHAYLGDDEKLKRAFDNSLYLLGVFLGGKLVGFIRCVGDGEHILLIQDLIISSQYRRKKLASKLIAKVFEKYKSVRAVYLFTDINAEISNKFYKSIGLQEISKLDIIAYGK